MNQGNRAQKITELFEEKNEPKSDEEQLEELADELEKKGWTQQAQQLRSDREASEFSVASLKSEFDLPEKFFDPHWPGDRAGELAQNPVEFIAREWNWSKEKATEYVDRWRQAGVRA